MEYEWGIHGDVYGVLSNRNRGLMGFQQEVYRNMMGHIASRINGDIHGDRMNTRENY
jgi:hypothetical protein